MTYSLNTLNASSAGKAAARTGIARVGQELSLVLGLVALVVWLLALLSYSPQDAAWSTSGTGAMASNWVGRLGAWLADSSYFLLGFSCWWGVLVLAWGWATALARWMRGGQEPEGAPGPLLRRLMFWGGMVLMLCTSTMLEWTRLYRFEDHLPSHAGGVLGYLLGPQAMRWLGFTGSGLLGIVLAVLALALVFRFSWGQLAEGLGARIDALVQRLLTQREKARDQAVGRRAAKARAEVVQEERAESAAHHPQPVKIVEPVLDEAPQSSRVVKERQQPLFTEMPDSHLPQVDLLDRAQARQESVAAETLEMTSRLIEKKLKDFGVDVTVVQAEPGPVITRYEIEPATGVKGAQIVNLAKDLARSLSLVSIRVVETIPGKTTMALELPNARRQTIRLSEVLGSQVYHDAKSLLTVGLGKDIVGNPVVADLAKMPHCLVAGTTGSGKSVGINAMILSLLYKAEARDVRLLMIDPKMLEMSVYEGIPHLLCPVVTDMKQAANGLNWCVAEMERRYKLMSKVGVRNLAGYNAKIDEAKERGEIIANPFSLTPEAPEPLARLPHIVVIIDELADLMMVVGKKIEELIARLAQKARAAGIHLILATQRPSVDVITGLIKANIPARIAFSVGSKIDSRTILDQMGAEALLGMGDMLYMASGTGLPVRVHGAFVSDEEVHRVVSYLKSQGEPDYIDGVLDASEGSEDGGGEAGEGASASGEQDPMYDQAVEVVLKDRKASISYVQRKLRIGYNRSANLLEQMERAGLVSALTASGQREVLVPARE
ncbi:DNA translocase FtsK [Acidovorax sp. HDW3]|uniref:DNA translocase FtsK n=1 Tax=Acidovorax sp. HDW3 TaxID=2714923 RepID=UPI00140D0A79|nr:DNA translocase FtsK [Acidovorax sp. HDW3]QIL43412.1 DNA translocase FtsK [Acidovorax sp. HDW3]